MTQKNQIGSDVLLDGTWLTAFFTVFCVLANIGTGIVLLFKYKVLHF